LGALLGPAAGKKKKDLTPLGKDQLQRLHALMDKDGDGKVSVADAVGFHDETLKATTHKDAQGIIEGMDKNKDGKLSADEMLAIHMGIGEDGQLDESTKQGAAKEFKEADKDGDGYLTDLEAAAMWFTGQAEEHVQEQITSLMGSFDENDDGQMSLKEFQKFFEPLDKDPAVAKKEEAEHLAEFGVLDVSGDGLVDRGEFAKYQSGLHGVELRLAALIKAADEDGDGLVTASELEAAREVFVEEDGHRHLQDWAFRLDL